MDFVKQEYWDKSYLEQSPFELPEKNPIKDWIIEVKSLIPGGDCIEIGTYPGGFINEFGKLGFEISGIDLTPRVVELNNLFAEKKYRIGSFWKSDFLTFVFDKKYDVVCSFGFIEHFVDYKSIIQKQADMLKSGGVLLIVAPCFSNLIQYVLRRLIDNENLKRHNLKSMNPAEWADYLENEGFYIVKKDYIGGFDFWYDNQKRNIIQKSIKRSVFYVLPLLKKIFSKKSSVYSPYCGIIAMKK